MNEATHLDLFTGIGGFTLAAERSGFRTIGFSEIDPYACAVLKKNWPHIANLGDVSRIRSSELPERPNVLTAGFPCQDISWNGKGAGLEGQRSGLWREVVRLTGELQPYFVLVENVPALKRRGFDQCKMDLEGIGYACQPFVVGAEAVKGSHKRNRVWIVAHLKSLGVEGMRAQGQQKPPSLVETLLPLSTHDGKWEVEPDVCRANDGLSNRAHRLKCLGNSIVPGIAQIFLEAIRDEINLRNLLT